MTWLASDFEYERKFRAASLRRISRAVDRYHHDKESAEKLRANQEQAAIRRRASAVAKQVAFLYQLIILIHGTRANRSDSTVDTGHKNIVGI